MSERLDRIEALIEGNATAIAELRTIVRDNAELIRSNTQLCQSNARATLALSETVTTDLHSTIITEWDLFSEITNLRKNLDAVIQNFVGIALALLQRINDVEEQRQPPADNNG